MKKYIAPNEKIITTIIMRQQLLSGSDPVKSVKIDSGEGEVNIEVSKSAFEGGTADSRSFSVWDDNED